MMPKYDTISSIMKLNPTASPEFLAEFTNEELTTYLHRLMRVSGATASAMSLLDTSGDDPTVGITARTL